MTMELLKELTEAVERGDEDKVAELTNAAVEEKLEPKNIMDNGLIAGMDVIGEQFRKHEIFLPDVLLAAKAMYAGMEIVKPLFIGGDVPTIAKIVIGTVHGDLHDLGKNLVGIMLKGAGFEVIDLGKDVPATEFVETAEREGAEAIGMSALLTTTQPVMKDVIELLDEKGLKGKIKTMVGGAPLSKEFANEIGADAYAFDAANAVERLKALVGSE